MFVLVFSVYLEVKIVLSHFGLAFDLNVQQLNNNEGRLQSAKALNLTAKQIDNSKGQILATDSLVLNSDNTNNLEGVIASVNSDSTLNITSLDNSKGEISAQNVKLTGQTLNNQQGSIQAKTGDLTLKVDQIDNGRAQDSAGNFTAGKNLNITAQQLNSTGQIYAGDTADLTVKQLQQDGQLAAQNKIKVQSDSISSSQNAIWAAGLDSEGKLSQSDATLNIDAQQAQIAGTILSGESIAINATKNADLSQSATQAKNIKVNTQVLNTSNAKIIAEQQLDLTATQNINNQAGQYSAVQVNIDTAQLNNDQGLIQHTGQNDFILNVSDRIDNNAGKIISNANTTEIKTNTLSSVAGEILHAGKQQLQITAQNLQGQQGKIQSNNNLKMNLGTANLDNATTAAQNINLTATELSHQHGQLIQSDANGQLSINVAQTLNNTSGVISAAGNTSIQTADLNNQQAVIQTLAGKDLKITSQKLDNQSGKIIAGRDVNLNVQQLNNDQGTVYADGKLELHAIQDVSNQQGLIASKQTLVVDAQNLNNEKGQIQSKLGDVSLTIKQTLNNQAGSIQSANALNITAAQLENQNGQLLAGTNTQINLAQLNNQSGTIYAKNQLDVNVTGTADNSAGTLAAEQNLNLNAQNLLNTAGQIRSEKADLIINTVQDIQNNIGLISAGKDLTLTAQDVDSQKGKIQSGANAKLQVNSIDNTEGTVYATEQLQLNATGTLNNSNGVVAAEQLADLQAGSVINDAGQIRSQQDQLKLNVQNELSNLAGEISADKAVELTANKLSNQQGKVIAGTSLNATVQQIDNTAGTLYANDQLTLNVADQLNNQSGTIAANQQVQIQANNLNNKAGKIRSENNALDLTVQQTLDNQSGEVFAGTQAKINATTVNNQQGTIYAKDQIDLTAGQLNNQQGQVYSAGSANVTVQGDVQNQKGVIVAEQNLNVQSNTLDNTEGTLRSEKADLTVNAQGQLINQQGDIYAAQNLSINSNGLVNNAGQIASQNQLKLNTQQQQLSNQNGKIIAKTVALTTGTLGNQTGLIQAEQAVKIDTQNHALLNNNSGNQAGILSQGSLEIANASQLDNISGYIASVGSATITAQNLNNNKGQINSQTDLSIQQQASDGRIDNLAGQIQAQQNVTLNADSINNSGTGSHIVAGEILSITANKVINAQTKDATVIAGLDGKNIEINAAELDNQSGVIRATDNAALNIRNILSNQSGSISSLNTLSVGTADKTLNLNNTGGELLAKNQLNLKANELVNKGNIISEGNIDIDLKQSYTHTKNDQIAVNGTLKLNTDNDLINQSELTAGQKLELSAKNINNEAGATISSNETHLIAQGTLHNQGLINGELTHIQADRVWNDGARIYGTHVAIQANTLDNKSNATGTGAVIASRGDMDLGIQILNNKSGGVVKDNGRDNAWIFSAGQLNVGGSLDENLKAQGNAAQIYNGSAVIESLGDLYLGAKSIQNINENLVINKLVEKSREKVTEYERDGQRWDSSIIRLGNSSRGLGNAVLFVPQVEGGAPTKEIGEEWTRYIYTNIHSQDEVQSTSPAQIIAGGNLGFNNDAVFSNKDSQVLVGLAITNGLDKIINDATQLYSQDSVASGGFSNTHSVGWNKTHTSHKHEWGRDVNYAPAPMNQTMPIILGIVKEYTTSQSNNPVESLTAVQVQQKIEDAQSVKQAQLNIQQTQNQQLNVDAGTEISQNASDLKKPLSPDQLKVDSQQSKEVNAQQQNVDQVKNHQIDGVTNDSTAITQTDDITIRTVSQDYLTLSSNALFITTKDSQANYLVETDPAYANYKKWLSSDYMLDALGLDPALQQKRIGDGYYEQRLVQDQVAKLTGYRFLEGYGSDEEQYKALMNNGLSFAKLYNLRPGIALTESQIAQLTSDIVWLEEKTIKLADGTTTKALVPQVYVQARVGDLKGDGTLISADSIKLDVQGDVFNSGTIAGRQTVVLSADNVKLLNGKIQGNQIGLNTRQDLNIIGGQIQADQAVDLNVGRNFNLESSTQNSQNIVGESVFSYKGLDRLAGIYSNAPLKQVDGKNLATSISIKVGGDTTLKAAEIQNNNGSIRIQTHGNLNVSGIQTGVSNKGYANEKNYNYSITQVDQGSSIQSQGTVDLSANKIQGKAVDIASQQGDIVLNAQQEISLENGKNLHSTDIAMSAQSDGLLGNKTERNDVWKSDQSIANGLKAGGNIVMNTSQGDITATHLKANAGKSIQVQAKNGNVSLNSALNENSQSTTSSSTNFATYNNRQSGYIDQEVAQTQLVAGKNVDINAGKNIELQANDITAGQSIFVGNTLMQRQADGTLKAADGSLMPENVKLSTLETHDQQWDEQQKGYRGVVKELMKVTEVGLAGVQSLFPGVKVDTKLTVGESNSKREEQIKQTGTNLTANDVYVGSSGQTTLTSADITAKNTILSGQKVTLNAAEEQNISATSHSKETIEGLGVKLNKDSVRLGGFVSEDTTQSTKTTETTYKAGSIQTENLKIQGAEGVDILGQNIKATGDTVIDHGQGDLNIGGYENKTTVEDKTHQETISTEVGVRNAYLDAALAIGAVKDAAEAVKQAKDQYSQAQRDYASGKITKEALDDTKANVAMATANLANAQIAVGSAAATAAASSATYGFTIGANGERIETTTTTNTTQGQWQGSNLDLNNLTLKSENQDVNVQGSRLTATGLTTFDGTKDFNINAGKEQNQQETSSKTNNQSVSYTYGGGGSASIGKQTSKAHDESLSHVNSQVELNKVSGSINKLNIQGGEVSIADRGDIKVNQIHVESLQDTASGNSSSKGGSVGVGIGSGGGNVTASYNQAKGQNDKAWVNETSKLLIGNAQNDADLDAMGVQKVSNIGGVIANATKKADGTLNDHGKLNYTGALELKDIQDHNSESNRGFNVSTSVGTSIKGESKESALHPSGSTTVGLQSTGNEKEQLTKATMGQGSVTNTTTTSNRDINNTQEITRDQVTGLLNGSVTVDNRLLTESGRAQIIQEQKDLPQNGKIIVGSTATGGLIVGSGIVGLLDEKGSVQDAATLTKNNASTAYDAEMAAGLQLIQDGTSSNVVDNQKLINEYNDQLTKGTSIKNTDVSLVDSLLNENYLKADATTNITNKTDIYLDKNSQKNTVNLVTHENAHQAGFGEKSADTLGWMGEAAFNVNSWVNSSNIDTAKTQIQNIPKVEVAGVNDAQTQLDLLKANTEKYDSQIAYNNEFDEHLNNKGFVALQKYLEVCKASKCSESDKNKVIAEIKQISAKNLKDYTTCKNSGQTACIQKNVQQIWAAEQFDDNKLKQLLGSSNVRLATNYDVKAADPQLFKQLEFLQYAQKNCQGISYGACGTKYEVSNRSAAQNVLIPAKSKVLDYIVGEKPKTGVSYYLAGIGYVAAEILIPESGTDVALTVFTGGAGKGAKLASVETKAGGSLASVTESQYKSVTKNPDSLVLCSNGVCFTAGTLIETDQGFKAVENFVGDEQVWSRNDRTLEYGYRPVIATKETADQTIFEVVIQNQQGQTETLETTAEHPFWIKNYGWLKASLLQSGMKLVDRNDEELTIVSQVLIPNKVETVYNIEVDGFHTYHVGKFGTWVHNANCCNVTRANLEAKYSTLDDKYFGKNGEIYWNNPITNKMEQINKTTDINGIPSVKNPITGKWEDASKVTVSTDHILPQDAFKKTPGFTSLPKDVQKALINDKLNLQPMLQSCNSSKCNLVESGAGGGWNTWKGTNVNPAYKAKLADIQKEMRAKVQRAIDANKVKIK